MFSKSLLFLYLAKKHEFNNISDALIELDKLDITNPRGEFERFELIIDYSNNDVIRANFQSKILLADFLRKLES